MPGSKTSNEQTSAVQQGTQIVLRGHGVPIHPPSATSDLLWHLPVNVTDTKFGARALAAAVRNVSQTRFFGLGRLRTDLPETGIH